MCNIYIIIMIDIETLKNTIKEFAEKYDFIQQIDIEKVLTVFDRQDCLKMNYKKFISINQHNDKTEIASGKINIVIDKVDEEERYYIDKTNYFYINTLDYTTKDSLIEAIIKECKTYKFI